MSQSYQRLPMRLACRGRRRGFRRLGLEALERRDCPAVQAFLNAGVLTVVGDEGNNDVAFVGRSDGFVQLVGDGVGHTFEGVKGIVARTGDGDDQIRGKIVLWVRDAQTPADTEPLRLDLNSGAGNDRFTITDDADPAASDRLDLVQSPVDISAELETGADELAVEFHRVDSSNVAVHSADGFDSVDVRTQTTYPG